MLRFITGRSGTGKTKRIIDLFSQKARQGEEKLLLLVPDQSTFENEKIFLKTVGAALSQNIMVLGFSRLCDYVFSKTGGVAGTPVDEGTRRIIMSMAVEQVSDRLELFSKQSSKSSLTELMVSSYEECQRCSITTRMLASAADNVKEKALSQKLRETALILDAYSGIIGSTYSDPCENLTRVYEILVENPIFEGYTVAVDSFSGFTAQQYKVLECLMETSADFFVCLTLDSAVTAEDSPFRTTVETKNKLLSIAEKLGMDVANPIIMSRNYRIDSPELAHLEQSLGTGKVTAFDKAPLDISLAQAPDIYAETRYVADCIKKLVVEYGYKYSEIAVICHDASKYSAHMSRAFSGNGIPAFMDYPEDIFVKPHVRLVCACLRAAAGGFDREDVLSLLKTGLTDNSLEEISKFENYLFTWNINRSDLLKEFTQNPAGFSREFTDENKRELFEVEKVRSSVIKPLCSFVEKTKSSTGREISVCLYNLLLELKADKMLLKLYDELASRGDNALAAQQIRLWNILVNVLDKTAAALGDFKLSLRRYLELLSMQFENETISDIPRSLDCVQFGQAQRIRLDSEPRAVFIIGFNMGEFPSVPSVSGVFTESERRLLSQVNLPFRDSFEEISGHESFLAYTALSSAKERLYISFHLQESGSEGTKPSELVSKITEVFPEIKITETALLPAKEILWSEKSALEYCAAAYNSKTEFVESLNDFLCKSEKYGECMQVIGRVVSDKPIRLYDKAFCKSFFGDNMLLSASRIEKYSQCAFRYFCSYGIKALEPRRAAIDAMEFGTLTHFVFEEFLRRNKGILLDSLTDEQIKLQIDEIYSEFIEKNLAGMDGKTPRFKTLLLKMKENSFYLLKHLASELSQSEFIPVDFELQIGTDIPTYTVSLPQGGSVSVIGAVDRVDIMEKSGKKYVRVIDYKTGNKEFLLSDVLCGLNLQMLVYLHAIETNGEARYGAGLVPAGILYVPSTAPSLALENEASDDEVRDKLRSKMKMNGLILCDTQVIKGMEKSASGVFIPASVKNDKPYSAKSLADLAQMGMIFKKIDKTIVQMAESLYSGDISAVPVKGKHANGCDYCPYDSVCNYRDGESRYKFAEDLKPGEAIQRLESEFKQGGGVK